MRDGGREARIPRSFRRRRWLVPADFFYEWQKTPHGKQPYAIGLADATPMAMAGVWERWNDPEAGQPLYTFFILTGPPDELCAPIHNPMPAHPDTEEWGKWLGEDEAKLEELLAMLRPYPAELMRGVSGRYAGRKGAQYDLGLLDPAA